jgi:hypothetical protein
LSAEAMRTEFVCIPRPITERFGHTATLLPSGEVLVAAGYAGGGRIKNAELYDPATGNWSNTGSLFIERNHHTATLLPSGEVLVAGGPNLGILSSAELYDPATVSQVTHVGTTCAHLSSETAQHLNSVLYTLSRGFISRVTPGNFLYWVPVTAPAGDNIVTITQAIPSGNYSTFFAADGDGSNVFDSNCGSLEKVITQDGNAVTVTFTAPSTGTYFIAVKFTSRNFNRQPAPSPPAVRYEFTTTGVPHSTSGLSLDD